MPTIQSPYIHTPMWPVQNVLTSTPLWGTFDTTMMQSNRDAINYGETAVGERMYSARQPMTVSNFGTETKIGNGALSRTSRETFEVSTEAISSIMQQDDQYEGSKTGSYSALGPTGFQQYTDRSFRSQQAMAAKAYEYFANYGG